MPMNWNDGSEDYNKIARLEHQLRGAEKINLQAEQRLVEVGKLLNEMWKSRDRWRRRAQLFLAATKHLRLRQEWQPMPRCPHEDPNELNPFIASCGMMFATLEESAAHDRKYHCR